MKHIKPLWIMFPLFLLASCDWDGAYRTRSFLHWESSLGECRDIHGADLTSKFRFRDFEGEDYTPLFNKDPAKSFLTLSVDYSSELQECTGTGHLRLALAGQTEAFIEKQFEYYAAPIELSAAWIHSSLEEEGIVPQNGFLFTNASWYRITIRMVLEEKPQEITFEFNRERDTGYPDVYK